MKQSPRISRHPVVVVLGHVDHGKTTLLDFIKKTNVVARESGGITQHIGAYEIIWHEKKITFLDTPGHESFAKMRERGARVADIAILVVAADDGVKPQTKEAYAAIQKAGIPFVVALNKIDKPNADEERAKSSLAEIGIFVEGRGGNVPIVAISAKSGTHVDELLDTLLLLAELENLTADPSLPAEGVVIEAHLDARRGPSAMLLVTSGTLQKGEFVLVGESSTPIRILEDALGNAIECAGPSSPARIAGFTSVPAVGAPFRSFRTKQELENNLIVEEKVYAKKEIIADIGILVKADVAGSLEALEDHIMSIIPADLSVKIFSGSVGDITEGDIKTISAAKKGIIIAFRVKTRDTAHNLMARFDITIKHCDVIYEALDWLREELKKSAPKKFTRTDLGKLVVLKIFKSGLGKKVIGGRVRSGKVPKDAEFEIVRGGDVVGRGSVVSIERNKIAVQELREEEEGGLLVHAQKAIEERDVLVFFTEHEI